MVWKLKQTPFLRKRWGFFMSRLKIDRLLLVLIPIILPFLPLFSPAYAEIKTFIEEYTYQASEADSKLSSRVIALEQVKRLLLEKLGTYLESETEVKNFQLTKDQIVILTAGIVRAEVIDERWDGKTYSLKAKIQADPTDVANSIYKLRQDHQKTKELEETRKKADEALKEVEKLKKELRIAKAQKTEQDKYAKAVNLLSDTDRLGKGLSSAPKILEKPDGRITDRTGTLTRDQIATLDQKLAGFEKETTNQIAVVLLPSLQGENLEDYSIRLMEKWVIGQKGKDKGVILLVFINDRKLRIEVGYGLEKALPDGLAGSIIREKIVPRFRSGQFYEGIDAGIKAIMAATKEKR